MNDVAVAIREDTGQVKARSGNQLSDTASVFCDSCKSTREIANAYLVDETRPSHLFDGSDFDPGCLGDSRHKVSVSFHLNKKGERVATFKYILKKRGDSRPGDPFSMTVINGKKFPILVPPEKRVG